MNNINQFLSEVLAHIRIFFNQLIDKDNISGRLVLFSAIYFILSSVRMYNIAYFIGFFYIIWLIEHK
jgi:hypothetical protein